MSTGAILLTDASVGAPRNSGTNGDLCGVLDWALPQAGWAIEYSSGNARVYRPPSGNRFRLHVNHDSAVSGLAQLAVWRGCENASNATTLIDAFPTVAQVANTSATVIVSSAASTATRAFRIIVSPTFVIYASNVTGVAGVWDVASFGDCWSRRVADTWATVCSARNNATATAYWITAVGPANTAATTAALSTHYFTRDITGTVKSSLTRPFNSGAQIGLVAGLQAARAGYLNEIVREPLLLTCMASSTVTAGANAIIGRGAIPNLWVGQYNGVGSVTDADTWTDSSYVSGSVFRMLKSNGTTSVILEESDTSIRPFL